MSRDATAAFGTAVEAVVVRPRYLVELQFRGGTTRWWTGVGTLSWAGEDWVGGGNLVDFSPIEESNEVIATGVRMSLSGIPSELLATALGERYQHRLCRAWFALMTDAGEIVADPYEIFRGYMDTMSIAETGTTGTIEVTAENRLIDLRRPRKCRYTSEDQRRLFPGDKGCDFVAAIQNREILWGVPFTPQTDTPVYRPEPGSGYGGAVRPNPGNHGGQPPPATGGAGHDEPIVIEDKERPR